MSYQESRRGGKPASAANAKRCSGAFREHFPTRHGGVDTLDFLRPGASLEEKSDLRETGGRCMLEGGRGTNSEE